MKKYSTEILEKAHSRCFSHKQEILESEKCVCFYCQENFPPAEIKEWFTEKIGGETAVCPNCGIDSILGSKSDLPIYDKEFLDQMTEYYF
ncbi:MAG: cytoplasmic protein [Rufibacter sp.]